MIHDFHKIKILNCFILILFCIFLFSACTEENNRAHFYFLLVLKKITEHKKIQMHK